MASVSFTTERGVHGRIANGRLGARVERSPSMCFSSCFFCGVLESFFGEKMVLCDCSGYRIVPPVANLDRCNIWFINSHPLSVDGRFSPNMPRIQVGVMHFPLSAEFMDACIHALQQSVEAPKPTSRGKEGRNSGGSEARARGK